MGDVMSSATSVLIALASFGVLLPLIVFVHEYGHFKTARLCGMRVDAFSIGFGPALFGWTDRKGTRWKVSAIPLGGYVKFFGDANAASAGMRVGSDLAPAEGEEPQGPGATQFKSERARLEAVLTEEEKRVCFHFKPIWQRMAVVAAGPFANFVLAVLIFAGLFMAVGRDVTPPVVGEVIAGSAAESAGLSTGDEVLRIDGRRVRSFEDMQSRVRLASDTLLDFEVERDGERLRFAATPTRQTRTDAYGNEMRVGVLGFSPYIAPTVGAVSRGSPAAAAGFETGDRVLSLDNEPVDTFYDLIDGFGARANQEVPVEIERGGERLVLTVRPELTGVGEEAVGRVGLAPEPYERRRYGPVSAVSESVVEVGTTIERTLTYLGRIVTGREDVRGLGGPVKIGQYAGQAVRSGFAMPDAEIALSNRLLTSLLNFLQLAALISVSIGFLNLLPVPVLDGGHLVFYAYEAVAGRPLPERVQGAGFTVGLVMVASLMIFVVVNDVISLL